jgi:glycosyltransferase involved in cell wall biosynthesis
VGTLIRLTAAIIVKDEAEHLRRCLASVANCCDEIVVVDTGSSDDTVQVALDAGARVLHRAWDGRFSPPRNLGLDHANGQWILYIDADEELRVSDRDGFLATLDSAVSANVVAMQIPFVPKSGTTPYWEWRLWQHRPELRFSGTMHECITEAISDLLSSDPALRIARCDLMMLHHYGYDGDQTAKHIRNLPLLRAELERTPDRTYLWNHLGRVLHALDQHDEADAAWERAVDIVRKNGVRDATDGMAFADLVISRVHRGEDVNELLAEAVSLFPENWFLHWTSAMDAWGKHDHDRVLQHTAILLALTPTEVLNSGLSYDRRIFGEWAHHLAGMSLFELGRNEEAASAFAAAGAANPDVSDYRVKELLARARSRATLQ